jgi:amino acid adenylation domain-containing protein
MSDAGALLAELHELGLVLWAEDDRLRFRGPAGALTGALRTRVQAVKPQLLELLRQSPAAAVYVPDRRIPHLPDAVTYPTSDAQRRLWVLSQLDEAAAAYHIAIHLRLHGPLDVNALVRALERLVARHEVLRTRFVVTDGVLRQCVAPEGAFRVRRVELGTDMQSEARLHTLAREEQRAPFDLAAGLPVRAVCATLGTHTHAMLLTIHHIAVDGWSLGILLHELALLYRAFQAGESDPLPPLRLQYRDFAQWQNRMLAGPAAEPMRKYWLDRLAGRAELLELPTRPRPPRQTYRGDMVTLTIDPARAAALSALVLHHRASLFMGLCAVVKCLLHRYSGQRTITLGTPVAGRDHPDLDGQVGHYLNILVLLDVVDDRQSFATLLAGVKRTLLEAFEHRDYPFNRLVDELGHERDPSHHPVIDVLVSLQNAGSLELKLPGITVSSLFAEPGTSKLDLTFDFEETAEGLMLGIRYNTDLFERDRMEAMGRHFQCLLDSVLANENRPVAALDLLPPDEYRLLVHDFNRTDADYPKDATVIALFDQQAAATPDQIAVVHGEEQCTYGELAAHSRRIAGILAGAPRGRNSPVGVLVDRSTWLSAALLGVLRAGAAYVPMDVGHPPSRLAAIIRKAGCRIVLTQGAPLLTGLEGVAFIPLDAPAIDSFDPAVAPRSGDPAYVIFTSGTTGEPKGVVVTHASLVAFLAAMTSAIGCGPADTLLSVTTPSFDIFGLELFLPLTTGGRIVIAGRDDIADGDRIARLIRRARVTLLQATPATWHLLCESGWPGDERLTILCGGEALSPTLAARLLSRGGALWNLYGPTETTIWSAAALLSDAGLPVPIGRPIANTRIYVVDANLRPVPIGVNGEIVIAGAGLARGYFGAPELTAQRFVPNPFGCGGQLYRTGDYGRWLPDGLLECLGRDDGQLKIRGHRIEAAEIEHRLRLLQGVRDAAVVARTISNGQPELCAYIVAAADCDPEQWRAALRETLPAAMVPSRFVTLERLPLNSSGKVDRRSLPAPLAVRRTATSRNAAERMLAALWAELLGVSAVGPEENFFELGGHSLTAMTLAGRITRSLGVECSLADVFTAPTPTALAARLSVRAPARFIPIRKVPDAPRYAASHAQRRLWAVSQAPRASVAYNMMQSILIERPPGAEPLDAAAFEEAFRQLIARHESLRTIFQDADDALWQIVHPADAAAEFHLDRIDLAEETEPEATARRLIATEAATPFDLATGPLLRAALLHLAPDRCVLTINMHHIIADAWSLRVMACELAREYAAVRCGSAGESAAPVLQYRDIAAWQTELEQRGVLAAQRAYWLAKLSGIAPARLPSDRPRRPERSFAGDAVTLLTPSDTVAGLRRLARCHRTGLFSVLLTAVNALIYRYTGVEDVVIGCVVSGRTVPELEDQIGFYVNTLPLRNIVRATASLDSLLSDIAHGTAEALAHQEYPFDQLLQELPARGPEPLFDVVIDYHENHDDDVTDALGGLRLSPFSGRPPVAKFDLLFLCIRDGDALRVTLEYATDLFEPARVAAMAAHFQQILQTMLTDVECPVIDLALSGPGAPGSAHTAREDALEQFDFAEDPS